VLPYSVDNAEFVSRFPSTRASPSPKIHQSLAHIERNLSSIDFVRTINMYTSVWRAGLCWDRAQNLIDGTGSRMFDL